MRRNKRRQRTLRNVLLCSLGVLTIVLTIFVGKFLINLQKAQNPSDAGRSDSITDAWKENNGSAVPTAPTKEATKIPEPTQVPLLPVEYAAEYTHLTNAAETTYYQNRIAVGIRYPEYENGKKLEKCMEFAEAFMQRRLNSYKNLKDLDGVFVIDYEDGAVESLTSVLFHFTQTVKGKTETEDLLWVYNDKAEEEVASDSLFADRAYIDIAKLLAEQNGMEAVSGTRDAFSLYRFTEEGVHFYYSSGESKAEITVPYIQLHTYMNVTTNGLYVKDMIRDLDPDKPMIALTFDDGPTGVENRTMRVLKALEENDSRATFFILGSVAERAKTELLQALGNSGNELASHTYSHDDRTLKNFTVEELTKEIEDTRRIIYEGTGKYPTFIRPPYGAYNDMVKANSYAPLITWNVDSDDWKLRDRDAVYAHVLEEAKDGRIILMHDIHEFTVEAAELLIPELVSRGFQLVTIRELFYYKGVELENGKVYHSAFN